MFQVPMTVTDMYIMLSDSVRHASSLLLFVSKLFHVSGLCAVETYSCSSPFPDSFFAGVDILLHMNMKHVYIHISGIWLMCLSRVTHKEGAAWEAVSVMWQGATLRD